MIDFPVYFDNAASTFPKPENVLSAVNRNLRSNTSNPGRSGHSLSFEAAERIFEAREVIPNILDANLKMLYSPKMRRNR